MFYKPWAYCILFFTILTVLPAGERDPSKGNLRPAGKVLVSELRFFNGNRISADMENNGTLVSDNRGQGSGLEWPRGSNKHAIYSAGLWIAGKVNGEIRTAVAEYRSEMVPGPYGSDPEAENRFYKFDFTGQGDPSEPDDFRAWPIHLGAPWIDANDDGLYNADDGDRPDIPGDQGLWYVANDGDPSSHFFGTDPLGIEVQVSTWGHDKA